MRLVSEVFAKSGPLLCETFATAGSLAPRDGSSFARYQDGPNRTESLIRAECHWLASALRFVPCTSAVWRRSPRGPGSSHNYVPRPNNSGSSPSVVGNCSSMSGCACAAPGATGLPVLFGSFLALQQWGKGFRGVPAARSAVCERSRFEPRIVNPGIMAAFGPVCQRPINDPRGDVSGDSGPQGQAYRALASQCHPAVQATCSRRRLGPP